MKFLNYIRRGTTYEDIEPDEIFMDAANLPGFDAQRLEGRIERPIKPAAFRNFVLAAVAVIVVYASQLAYLQIVSFESFSARAEQNRLEQSTVIADRGRILDRNGVALAENTPTEDGYALRAYPLKDAAAHLVGYVSYPKKDENGHWYQSATEGVSGVEHIYDSRLRGENGLLISEIDATEDVVSGSVVRQPISGSDLTLSIDSELQRELFAAIKARADESGWRGGAGVIMDIETGEVLALTSYPSFSNEVMSSGVGEEIDGYLTSSASPLLNRATSGLYAPGSVVKPFVAVAALEENIISPEKQILSTGSISIPNPYDETKSTIFRDWRAHGLVDMRRAIAVSSDVYFYVVGGGFEGQRGLGISRIDRYMRMFGFGETTGSALEGEAEGVVPNPDWKAENFDGEQWFLGNTFHTSIGQYGFEVTVLQLARSTAALQSGTLVTPTLLKDERGERQILDINPLHLKIAREGMRLAVTEGTAQALSVEGLRVAGKTGTAEVGTRNEFSNSVIIGVFPYENPRYSFALLMERAKAGTLQGAPAAMRPVLEWIVKNRPEMTLTRE